MFLRLRNISRRTLISSSAALLLAGASAGCGASQYTADKNADHEYQRTADTAVSAIDYGGDYAGDDGMGAGEVATGEGYTDYGHNPNTDTKVDNLSTFAIDVDTASYTIARRKLFEGGLPPAASVRVEEFVNFFRYQYAGPDGGMPFAVHVDGAPSPWTSSEKILRIGIQGKTVADAERKPVNLTFLVDVSGSMSSADKLGLAVESLQLLVGQLDERDSIALVTYAGNTRVVLPATRVTDDNRSTIIDALGGLNAGGSTAMSSGLQLAYEEASKAAEDGTVNRVIVLSDGDANVGSTAHGDMLTSIQHYVEENITMSTIGLGMGNYQDTTMEQLANQGNGNYYYIDTAKQAKRVFVDDLGGTLEVIAKDVKVQVEFDTENVESYRLIGYENRDIADEDFRDDKVDAGEIGAGHTVTAVYAITLADQAEERLGLVRVRFKQPEGDVAAETIRDIRMTDLAQSIEAADPDLRFATAVVGFAERLRHNPDTSEFSFAAIRSLAESASGTDPDRHEFIALVDAASANEDR